MKAQFNDSTLSTKPMSYIELHRVARLASARPLRFRSNWPRLQPIGNAGAGLVDRNGVYGRNGFRLQHASKIFDRFGCEVSLEDGGILPVLVENRTGYRNLCELLTQAHLQSEKGKCAVDGASWPQFAKG